MPSMCRFLGPLLIALPMASHAQEPPPRWIEQSRALASQFSAELQGELSRALAAGGPLAAISVCKSRAPAIAARLSKDSGAVVSRTALRVRNPANAPDAMDRAVLEQFAAELASGRFTLPLEAVFELRDTRGVEHRYLRAIEMQGLCVSCHGAALAPQVAAAIAREYPADQATGFEVGQLRGAISVRWPAAPSSPVRP